MDIRSIDKDFNEAMYQYFYYDLWKGGKLNGANHFTSMDLFNPSR